MKLTHFSKTDVGLVRPANEDSIGSLIKQEGIYTNIYIVCDGMGGHVGGARASQSAVRHIKEYFSNTPDPTPNTALKEAIEFANMQIFADATENPEFKGMGTTVTLMVESDGLLYIAHVGDSRIYINTDKKLVRITKDHSFVQSLVDAGQLTDAQMETHPRKNELTKALGIAIDVDVEVAPQPIRAKKGDKFLLCTDGLCGLINDTRISSIINSNSDLKETVHQLIEDANKAGGHDNISADLIEVTESEFTKSKFIDKNNVPVSNTGTRQVFIDPKNDKPIINKKLIQIILSVVVLIGLVGGGYLLYEKITHPPTPTPPVEELAEKSFEQKLLELDLDETFSEKLGIIYAAEMKDLEDWNFEEFINAISDNNYKAISVDNKQKQRFFIAKTKEILDRDEAIEMYKNDSDKSFEKGDFIFIKTKYLEYIDEVNTVTILRKTHIQALETTKVIEIQNKLKEYKEAIETNRDRDKRLTEGDDTDFLTTEYTLKYKGLWQFHDHKHPKPQGGECKVKFTIEHPISEKHIDGEYSHSYPATQEHEDKTLLNIIKDIFKENTFTRDIIPSNYEKYINIPEKTERQCEKQTVPVTYTIKVGDIIIPFEGSFTEIIPGDTTLCKQESETAKKDDKELTGYFPKYTWHREECLEDQNLPNDGNESYQYTPYLVELNKMYEKEIEIMGHEDFKDYTISLTDNFGEGCPDQVYFFSDENQDRKKTRKNFENTFTEEQLDILDGCNEPININKCPPKKQ